MFNRPRKRKTKKVTFMITDEEFEEMKTACYDQRYLSVAEFVRDAIELKMSYSKDLYD